MRWAGRRAHHAGRGRGDQPVRWWSSWGAISQAKLEEARRSCPLVTADELHQVRLKVLAHAESNRARYGAELQKELEAMLDRLVAEYHAKGVEREAQAEQKRREHEATVRGLADREGRAVHGEAAWQALTADERAQVVAEAADILENGQKTATLWWHLDDDAQKRKAGGQEYQACEQAAYQEFGLGFISWLKLDREERRRRIAQHQQRAQQAASLTKVARDKAMCRPEV